MNTGAHDFSSSPANRWILEHADLPNDMMIDLILKQFSLWRRRVENAKTQEDADSVRAEANLSVIYLMTERGYSIRDTVADMSYWKFNDIISDETLAEAYGVSVDWLSNVVPLGFQVAKCETCGKDYIANAHNRNEYAALCEGIRLGAYGLCPNCFGDGKSSILRKMPYAEYLKTPHWQALRDQTLARYGHRCAICNTDKNPLQIHHRTYVRKGMELPEDVIALCNQCHKLFHENGKLS